MEHNKYFSAYEGILEGYLQGREEHFLLQAFQLGRDMVEDGRSIELAVHIHFRVLEKLKNSIFTRYPDVERRWILPFLELTTPFGLACPNGSYGVTKLSERLGTAISGRNLAEEELRKTLEKHTAIIDNSLTGIYIIQDGKLQFVNNRFAEIYGYSKEDLIGMDPDKLVHPEDRNKIREMRSKILMDENPRLEYEARGVKKNGEIIWVKRRNTRIENEGGLAILGNISDITRRKQLEAQLLQAQKMEAVGTLASGVAHDFNNVLSGISGYTQLLMMDKKASDPEYDNLRQIQSLIHKAGNLTRNILAFTRQTESGPRPCDLNDEVKAVVKFLSCTFPKTIEINLELEENLHTINVDPTQINQILLNLCINAGDGMPEGGRLSIKTKNAFLDEASCHAHQAITPTLPSPPGPDLVFNGKSMLRGCRAPGPDRVFLSEALSNFCRARAGRAGFKGKGLGGGGKYVELSVSDTGCGIHRATLSRIFDPFFTTKPVGKGTGLGLSIVHGLVTTHGGDISVHSKPGEGTTFKIYFPAIEKTAGSRTSRPHEEIQNGKGTILFVDDEEMVRNVGKELLTRLGYDVITARDGEEAIKIVRQCSQADRRNAEAGPQKNQSKIPARQSPPPPPASRGSAEADGLQALAGGQNPRSKIDLVILDLIMPGMNGKSCLKTILEYNPEAKILMSSGLCEKSMCDELLEIGAKGYIAKPYDLADLSKKIKEVMEGG